MKKFYLYFFCLILCLGFCGGFVTSQSVYAQVDSISLQIYNSDGTTQPTQESGVYQAPFSGNESSPYATYVIKATVVPTTTEYVTWKVGGTVLDFASSNEIENPKYVAYRKLDNSMTFTPLLPGTFTIICSLESKESNAITLQAQSTTPTEVKINTTSNLTQNIESFTDIVLEAKLNREAFIDLSKCEFRWYKNDTGTDDQLSESSSRLTITKQMLKDENISIGTTKIYVVVVPENANPLTNYISITLTNNQSYAISIATTQSTEQTIDSDVVPLDFKATITPLLPSSYTIDWFVLNNKSSVYQKQNTQGGTEYTFNSLEKKAGTYKVFARMNELDDGGKIVSEAVSNVCIITILPKEETPPSTFEINIDSTYNNKDTNVESFKFSIDTQNYYDEERIVWFVSGQTWGEGSTLNFEPPVANTYKIEAKLILDDGSMRSLGYKNVEAKSTQMNIMWVYLGVAVGALIIICALSIVISNKKREKIW